MEQWNIYGTDVIWWKDFGRRYTRSIIRYQEWNWPRVWKFHYCLIPKSIKSIKKDIIHHMTSAARTIIAKNWKKTESSLSRLDMWDERNTIHGGTYQRGRKYNKSITRELEKMGGVSVIESGSRIYIGKEEWGYVDLLKFFFFLCMNEACMGR